MGYMGGKGAPGLAQWIINRMPPHGMYVEPFLGHGAVMRMKKPAAASYGFDLDEDVIRFWGGIAIDGTVTRQCGLNYLESFDENNTDAVIYCDPPYPRECRVDGTRDYYRYEMTDEHHDRLLVAVNRLQCHVMVSSYWNERYADSLSHWRQYQTETWTRGGRAATEWLWCNFERPEELHDYRYLGDTFRERERISRKVRRHVERLKRMPVLERQAIRAAHLEAFG